MSFPKLFISSFVCYSDLFTTLCLLTARGRSRGPCAISLCIVLFICLCVFVPFWPYLCHWCIFKSMNCSCYVCVEFSSYNQYSLSYSFQRRTARASYYATGSHATALMGASIRHNVGISVIVVLSPTNYTIFNYSILNYSIINYTILNST